MITSTEKLQHDKATSNFIEKVRVDQNDQMHWFHAQCAALARDFECVLARVWAEVALKLTDKERVLSSIFEELQTTLVGLEQPALEQRRAQIDATQYDIAQLLEDFDRTLQCAEKVRHDHALKLIGMSMENTMDIRRGVPSEVMQTLADESRKINCAILRNREVYVSISAQLRLKAIELDKLISQNWTTVEHTWRVLNYKHAIEKFRIALASSAYRNPPARVASLETLRAEQRMHHTRMLDQLHSVLRLTPPAQLTPNSVEEWNAALRGELTQAVQDHKRSTQLLRAQEDVMHTSCTELVEKLRSDLREFRVVDDRDMVAILAECRGLLDSRGRESLALLAQVEAVLDVHASALARACSALCHYLTRVAAMLEIQELEAKVMRQTYQERLLQLHNDFATTNQAQEDKLQRIITVMQGEADDEELYRLLQKALDILHLIEEGYRNFCAAGIAMSVDYPNDTKAMLVQQQEAVCFIFGLTVDKEVWRDSKKPVLSAAPTPTKEEQKEGENEEVAEEEPSPVVDKKQTKKRGSRREFRSTSPNNPSRPPSSMRPVPSASSSSIPARSASPIIATAQQPRRKSPQRRKRDLEKEELKEEKEKEEIPIPTPSPSPAVPEIIEMEKDPQEDVDVVTTSLAKYYILTNRPPLLYPEDPPATTLTQAPTTELVPASVPVPDPVTSSSNPHHLPLSSASTTANNSHRMGAAHRLAGLPNSTTRRRPASSRIGHGGSATALGFSASVPPPAPPRTQAQEINDEIDRLKIEIMKGPVGGPLDPDGTRCLEMYAVPEALILYLEQSVRRSLINHIEGLFNTLLLSAIEEGKNSKRTFTSDLEERLRLHRPRSGHIELEIYHQRAGDLHAHRVRFDRHVQSLTENFNQECRGVHSSTKEIQSSLDEYSKAQVGRIVAMGNANNTLTLQVLLREARGAHKNVLELINSKVAQLRVRISKTGQSVAAENYTDNLRKDGGGTSASEISHISSHLILLKQSVDAKCLQVTTHIDQVAHVLTRNAAIALQSVETAHGAHHEDLTFLEGINFRSGILASRVRAEITRCERQHHAIASLVEKLASPTVNELLPLVDAIRRAVFYRAVYLDVLQSPLTLTPSLLGPEISPLPLSALSFFLESDIGDSAGEDVDDDDAEATASARGKEDKYKSRGERKGKNQQQGGGASSRRSQAGSTEPPDDGDDDKEGPKNRRRKSVRSSGATSPLPLLTSGSAPGSASRTRRGPKRERASSFTQAVTSIMTHCRKDAQQFCEEYYRVKGERQATRPNRIPASLPLLLQSLEGGYTQHEQAIAAHRTLSMKSFHAHLVTARSHLCAIPRSILQGMASALLTQCRAQQDQMENDFACKKSAWRLEREKLHNSIRPQMAHPNYHAQLDTFAAQAQNEHAANIATIHAYCDGAKRTQDEHAARMCEDLGSTSDALFRLLDEFILPQDLVSGGTDSPGVASSSVQQVLKRMQSLNIKSTVSETPAQRISSNLTRESTANLTNLTSQISLTSLTETPTTNTEIDKSDRTDKQDKQDKSEKVLQKSKVKEVKGEVPRKSRLGVRIREESSSDQKTTIDSIRPFPKHTYTPLPPLPPPAKELPPTTLPPAVQETKKNAKSGRGAPTSITKVPMPTSQASHVHYATPAHEAVAAARTQAYTQYAQHYAKALADAEMARSVLLDEEQRDFDYLMQALVSLRKQYRV